MADPVPAVPPVKINWLGLIPIGLALVQWTVGIVPAGSTAAHILNLALVALAALAPQVVSKKA